MWKLSTKSSNENKVHALRRGTEFNPVISVTRILACSVKRSGYSYHITASYRYSSRFGRRERVQHKASSRARGKHDYLPTLESKLKFLTQRFVSCWNYQSGVQSELENHARYTVKRLTVKYILFEQREKCVLPYCTNTEALRWIKVWSWWTINTVN